MSLKEKIKQDLNLALKEGKATEVSVLRLVNAAVLNKEKEKRYKVSKEKPEAAEAELQKESQLGEEELLEVISSEAKKRKESIVEFEVQSPTGSKNSFLGICGAGFVNPSSNMLYSINFFRASFAFCSLNPSA